MHPKYLALKQQFEPQTWLADAARRVHQLQVVTHSLKPIHPDAKGTNLYVEPNQLDREPWVGSQCLPADFQGDVVGNAAALDVYKFLKQKWDGRSLLERALDFDEALIEALSPNRAQAEEWVNAFARITEPKSDLASHTRGKQLYWLVGDDPTDDSNYRLVAPLYATALTQRFYEQVSLNTWFFGDDNKAARKALRERTRHDGGYKSYPNLAIQKFGGTKPQNISQLNSERRGENYLLASLPPNWKSRDIYPPWRDAFRSFQRRTAVWQKLVELKRFLQTDPVSNMDTRDYRDDITAILVDELMLFTFDMHSLAPGWTADEKCRLAPAEQYWLDPGRAEMDSEFEEARRLSNWHEEVSGRAADWLNRELNRTTALNMGDVEHSHWRRRFDGVMTEFRRQLDDLQDALRDEQDEGEAA